MFDSTQLCIDDTPQLFLDDWLVESAHAITRRWHKPVRHPQSPLLCGDRPWEHFPYFTYSNYGVLRDPRDGLFRCWYEDLGPLGADGGHPMRNRLLYAESRDGLHFDKPEMEIVRHRGGPTNVVAGCDLGEGSGPANPWPEEGVHSAAIVLDPHPPHADERFRMWFSRCPLRAGEPPHVITCAHSPDGLHWHPYPEPPSMGSSRHVGDVSCLWYDPDGRSFVMNTRHGAMGCAAWPAGFARAAAGWAGPFAPHRPDLMNKRRVYQSRSHDFRHWSEPLLLFSPDSAWDNLDEMHYGMAQFRAGRQHLGTLGIFRHADNEMEVRLMHSRDGVRWQPADRAAPFLAPRGPGHWDAHLVSIVSPPIPVGDELWFYHGGASGHHDYWMSGSEGLDHPEARAPGEVRFGLGLAVLRRDGFCSLDTGDVRAGALGIRPVRSAGTRLRINARCRDGGSIRVGALAPEGGALEGCSVEACDPFTGDDVAHTVTWSGSEEIPGAGRFRRLVFHLERAEIFSFRFV